MPSPVARVAADLAAVQGELRAVLEGLAATDWDRPSAAAGWTVRHQVRHLAQGEDLAGLAARDPEAFGAELVRMLGDLEAVERATTGPTDEPDPALLERWWAAAEGLRAAVLAGPPDERIGWVTGPMGRASFLTARVMETFAHGHDVAAGLGLPVRFDAALPHVAHLGVATRGFSFANRGLPVPEATLRVELVGPDGGLLVLGPEGADDVVRGPLLDLCLVVTQRRRPGATALVAEGPSAAAWLAVAQCFAGPPTDAAPEPSS